ncbi:MAG TPA: hypothetical protein VL346_13195 [Acidobacteriaceae bacterium]|jgi:ribosomal protein L7/L12|nr:hypothetical protein [Acidobacteriaceae bacterium]
MATRPKAVDEAAAIKAVKKIIDAGRGYEAALKFLRDSNYDQIDSIKVMRSAKNISLKQAKELVHYSRPWEDRRAAAEDIHEAAFEVIEDMKREEPE